MDELDFQRFQDRQVRHLSGGNRQKLNLSVALMHEPDQLLQDATGGDRSRLVFVCRFVGLVSDNFLETVSVSPLAGHRSIGSDCIGLAQRVDV